MKRGLLILSMLAVAGCATQGGVVQSFWSSIFGRKAAAVQTTQAKQETLEDKAVKSAQKEIVKTGVALSAAKVQHPDDRAVEIAQRTNSNAQSLLNQREPLSLSDQQEAESVASGLLSVETAKRETAEKAQHQAEGDNRRLSDELSAVSAKLKKLEADAATEAATNLRLANDLRTERVMKYGGMALSAALGLLAIAYKLNIGRLQEGLGTVLAKVQTDHGKEAGDAARTAAGVVLHTGEQKGVFKIFSALTQK